jgi:hypothetical protein
LIDCSAVDGPDLAIKEGRKSSDLTKVNRQKH